ncbi:MAG: hypothetical protein AAF547_20885 [Actinomycetota bacterium]
MTTPNGGEQPGRSTVRVGAYPGSFNPPTMAHLAIAAAARDRHGLDRVELVISRSALAKEDVVHPRFDDRIQVVRESVTEHEWLDVRVTDAQLLVDIAAGHDLLIMGADKWRQIQDPVWYGDDLAARDAALAALPTVAVVPRDEVAVPLDLVLPVDPAMVEAVSSTRARAGATELMTAAARAFAERTGAWTEPERYDRWVVGQG